VFLTSAWGGYYLSRADEQRMLALWRTPTGDPLTDAIRTEMADELEAVIALAEAQLQPRRAA